MKKKYLLNFIWTLLTTLGFFISTYDLYNGVTNVKNLFKVEIIIIFVVFLLLYFFYNKVNSKNLSISKKFLSVLFAIMIVLGNSFIKIDSWDLVFGNLLLGFVSLISVIGYYILFCKGFVLLNKYLENDKIKDINVKKNNKILKFIDDKPFLSTLIVLALFWLIYFIAYYPIILSPDPNYQILQYFGIPTKYLQYSSNLSITLTNHHPLFHTLLIGKCIEIGKLLINDNFGLFLYSFLQAGTLALTLAYTMLFLKKHNVNKKFRLILLAIYTLTPMYAFYAISAVKDTFYTCFVILYIIFLIDYLKTKNTSIKKIICLFFILIFISLFRNNGFYLIVLSFPFIIFYNKKNIVKLGGLFVLFAGVYLSYSKVLLPSLGITAISKQEALSIPFQQTARYARDNGDDLTSEEIEIIDKVLDYDTLASRYNPNLSDNVKNYYNGYATTKDLKAYFKVWLEGLTKHPGTYFQATFNNTYGYLTPNSTKWYIHTTYKPVANGNGQIIVPNSNLVTDHWPDISNVVDYHFNGLTGLRKVVKGYGEAFPYIPIIGLLSNIGANTWMLLILSVYLCTKENKKYLIALVPLYLTLLMCIAGPANTYFRYAMPYVFIMPFLLTLFIPKIKKS